MEPRIRYAKTADGVNIAWYSIGSGLPLVWLPYGPYTNTLHEWSIPETRRVLETLAKQMQLIRYDTRGFSLSDRGAFDYSLDAMVLDLEAVVSAAGLMRFVLTAPMIMSLPAMAYASRHPDRVIALLANAPFASGNDIVHGTDYHTIVKLARSDWDFAKRTTVFSQAGGWSQTATLAELNSMLDVSATQESFVGWYEGIATWDVSDLVSVLTVPTLITHDGGHNLVPPEASRRLATLIPNSSFHLITPGGPTVFELSAQFLASVLRSQPQPEAPTPGGLRTVLFTDLVDHTKMMQRLGDAKGRDVLREHERITRDLLKQHGGAEVKTMGDGFMASFGSVTKAMECAIALQRAFAAHTESMPEPLHVRVGLNAGEPIEEDGDLFGSTVILASRIAARAAAGEILVPDTVRGLLSGKGFVFGDRGETALKGFEDTVRLWDVRWRE